MKMSLFAKTLAYVAGIGLAFTSSSLLAGPVSCLDCQKITDQNKFMQCIQNCQAPKKEEPVSKSMVAKKKAAENAGWVFVKEVDDMSDKVRYNAIKESSSTIEFLNRRVSQKLLLVSSPDIKGNVAIIHIGGGDLSIYFDHSLKHEKFQLRVDKNKAHSIKGARIWEGKALFFPVSQSLLKEIKNGSKLLVYVPVFMLDSKRKMQWDLEGASDAVDVILKPKGLTFTTL